MNILSITFRSKEFFTKNMKQNKPLIVVLGLFVKYA